MVWGAWGLWRKKKRIPIVYKADVLPLKILLLYIFTRRHLKLGVDETFAWDPMPIA